jgi:hypothetical protein
VQEDDEPYGVTVARKWKRHVDAMKDAGLLDGMWESHSPYWVGTGDVGRLDSQSLQRDSAILANTMAEMFESFKGTESRDPGPRTPTL